MSWLDGINLSLIHFPGMNLADVCLCARAAASGYSTKWGREEIIRAVEVLQVRRDNWRRSARLEQEKLDQIFYEMVCATLEEVLAREWWQEKEQVA